MITVDLHLHSTFSDGSLTIQQLVDLCGHNRLDAIAITDHLCATNGIPGKVANYLNLTLNENNWKDYQREISIIANRAWREYKMLVLPGVEFTRNTFTHGRNAHLLGLGLREFISPNQTEEAWLAAAKATGALTVAAHPMKVMDANSQTYYLLKNKEKFEPLIDVWEVANGRTFWPEMLNSNYTLIATSDLHVKEKWHGWRTRIDCDKDPEALLASVKNKKVRRSYVYIDGDCRSPKKEILQLDTQIVSKRTSNAQYLSPN